MERDTPDAVLSAFDWGCEGGTAESCMTCKKLLDAAHKIVETCIRTRDQAVEAEKRWGREPVTKLGRIVDILSDPRCQDHREFVRSAFFIKEDGESPVMGTSKDDVTVEVDWDADKGLAHLVERDSPQSVYRGEILLLDSESDDSGLSCMGRLRDDDFISIDLMKKWISTCEQLHTSTCCASTSPSTSLSWMIDTISGCLVPAQKGTRYVALSYVWGQTEMLKTTTETLSVLKKPGALDANTSLNIPPVIRHAIALLPKLGERYLWVDALCITQDDIESLTRHIRHMASIYESALFTIVAADGTDANHGIPGIRGVSTARKLPPAVPLTSRLRLRPRVSVNILSSPWGSRGWTFQEHLFSRKKLVFVHGSVQWICQECRCFEDLHQESPSIRKLKIRDYDMNQELESVGELAVQYPMTSQVEKLLWQYTSRDLTHQYDILNAVDAVFTAHHGAFPHGFLWGLPVDFFDVSLLWTCSGDGRKRRQAYSPSSQSRFPSWTWAGWIGTLDYTQWPAATYIKDADEGDYVGVKKYQTIPICEWHQRSNSDSPESLIPGQNAAYSYKQTYMGRKDGLPRGWTYQDEPSGPDCLEDTCSMDEYYQVRHLMTPYYYSHEAAPGVKFWHPVPISLDAPSNTTAAPTNGGIICAKTQSGRLWVTRAKDHPAALPNNDHFGDPEQAYVNLFSGELKIDIVLTNKKGDLVGYLEINGQNDLDMVKKYERQADEAGYPCELVAISKGNDFVHPMEPDKEQYTFYNVLWVKWEDGIAYRRGVGRVKRETWESIDLEDVDLVLG